MIRVRNATKSYGNILALNNISFDIREGEKLAIVGPNGAGKTTLVRALMGIISLDRGKIEGIEKDPKYVGYAPQIPVYFPFHRAIDVCYFSLRFAGYPKKSAKSIASEWLKRVGISPSATGISLSGGKRKLLLIAIAMAKNPKILILDEPTAMVDAGTKNVIWSLIEKYNGTLILVTHDFDELKLAHRVMLMQNGKIKYIGPLSEFGNKIRKGYIVEIFTDRGVEKYEIDRVDAFSPPKKSFNEIKIRKITPEDLEVISNE